MASLLIVEDERHLRRILTLFLTEQGHDVVNVESGEAALERAASQTFDVVVLDLNLPGINGVQTLQALRERAPGTACIIITAFGSIRSAVEAMHAGACDYVAKPFDNDELLLCVQRALEVQRLNAEVVSLRTELASRYGFTDIVGQSASLREVFNLMHRVAATDVTVLVLGESGTGKELVARGIHQQSRRSSGPFVPVNCSAIPSTLIESEFFGHERGAFTDAKEQRVGKFEQAHRGTLFLDEVGDLALDAQAKLLRVLQDHQVFRVGSNKPIAVDVRVIAATHRNLDAAVASGRFRHDLFWRLNVVSLQLPALRDRADDLPALLDYLLERTNRALGTAVTTIAPDALRLLLAYDWPGNVRELENAVTRAVVLAQGATLQASDLPWRLRAGGTPVADGAEGGGAELLTLEDAVARATERVERVVIRATLARHQGNRQATATSLRINRKTLFNKMRAYGLSTEDADADQADPLSTVSSETLRRSD